jgi:hypothetical protein
MAVLSLGFGAGRLRAACGCALRGAGRAATFSARSGGLALLRGRIRGIRRGRGGVFRLTAALCFRTQMIALGNEIFGRLLDLIGIHGCLGARWRHVVDGRKKRRIISAGRTARHADSQRGSEHRRREYARRYARSAMHSCLQHALWQGAPSRSIVTEMPPRPPLNVSEFPVTSIIYVNQLRGHTSGHGSFPICRNKDRALPACCVRLQGLHESRDSHCARVLCAGRKQAISAVRTGKSFSH